MHNTRVWHGGLITAAVLTAFLPFFTAFAQTATSTASERAALEAQLAEVQAEQVQAEQELIAAESKSSSLQNDIDLLAAKIKTEQLDIQAKNLTIQTLGGNISDEQSQINDLDAQIAQDKQGIAAALVEMQETEDMSDVEVLFSSGTISDFWNDVIQLESLQQNATDLSLQLSAAETSSTAEEASLVAERNATIDAQYALKEEQSALKQNQTQEEQLLSVSKNNESAYSSLVAQKKAEAEAINTKLFALAGGSNPIPFGQAYQYALAAQQETGVDPAFLLAIMTQESNLGTNQGMCYLVNTATGAGVGVKSGETIAKVMNPTRDIPPFLTITSDLDMDPLHTVVSCPQSVGWGGAMGPAQFIPSTWMSLAGKVTAALGLTGMANPWNPAEAFTASAMYLAELGAGGGGYTAEYNAACKYYSGSPCSESALVAGYGGSVMSIASTIQTTEIDELQSL